MSPAIHRIGGGGLLVVSVLLRFSSDGCVEGLDDMKAKLLGLIDQIATLYRS